MKNKKIITVIISITIILTLSITIYMYYTRDTSQNSQVIVNINMQQLDKNISKNGGFDETNTTIIDKAIAVSNFDLDESSIQEVIGRLPLINIKSSMYIVIKASDGKTDYVKQKLEEYAINYEKQWSNYLEDQYDLVKKRQIGIKGNYVYLIISDNASDLVNLIK